MNIRFAVASLAFAAASLNAAAASAQDYLTGSVGWFDVTRQDNEAASFGLEYRFDPFWYQLRPIVGAFGTTDGSVYGYAGLQYDIEIMKDILFLSPNFAAGAYSRGDDGKKLGGAIEFRSGIELQYQMQNQHRIGVAFNHMSNASIYDRNPGVENLMLTYSIPT